MILSKYHLAKLEWCSSIKSLEDRTEMCMKNSIIAALFENLNACFKDTLDSLKTQKENM